jgi:hypothetical protein
MLLNKSFNLKHTSPMKGYVGLTIKEQRLEILLKNCSAFTECNM